MNEIAFVRFLWGTGLCKNCIFRATAETQPFLRCTMHRASKWHQGLSDWGKLNNMNTNHTHNTTSSKPIVGSCTAFPFHAKKVRPLGLHIQKPVYLPQFLLWGCVLTLDNTMTKDTVNKGLNNLSWSVTLPFCCSGTGQGCKTRPGFCSLLELLGRS